MTVGHGRPDASRGSAADHRRFVAIDDMPAVGDRRRMAEAGEPARPQGRLVNEGCDMTRVTAFSSPLLLGFDEIERMLDRASKAANDGYPPYNIERLPGQSGRGDVLRITLAVAGFTRDCLEVTLEESQLVIRGRQIDDGEPRQYLHRGIAARQFQRTFVLAEGIEILGAELKNGLLSIDLARPEPERLVRKIDIVARD